MKHASRTMLRSSCQNTEAAPIDLIHLECVKTLRKRHTNKKDRKTHRDNVFYKQKNRSLNEAETERRDANKNNRDTF